MSDPLSVKVQFFGICTHFSPEFMPDAVDWFHRVVLVNASDGAAFREEHPQLAGVDAHVARLQIQLSDLIGPPPATPDFPITFNDGITVEWSLDGVFLKIGEAIPTASPAQPPTCIPSLSTYCNTSKIASPGPRAYEANRDNTACFFDFESVNIEGWGLRGGAAVAVIPVFSDSPTITVTSFQGETITFPIRAGAEITVSNIPEDQKTDKDQDFLLHFLTVSPFPENPGFPPATPLPRPCLGTLNTYNPPRKLDPDLSTPGCSDSNYP